MGVVGRGLGIGCGHRDMKPTINETPSYHLYLSYWVSGLKYKNIVLKNADLNVFTV